MGFQKGHAPVNTKSMVATRKARGNFAWTPQQKKKMSETMKRKCQLPEERARRSATMIRLMTTGKIKKFNTKPELAMKEILEFWGIKYEFQKVIKGIIVDFYIPSKKWVIFVDGEYWHNYPHGTEKDRRQDKILWDSGYVVKRYWGKPTLKQMVSCSIKYFYDSLVEHRDTKHLIPCRV